MDALSDFDESTKAWLEKKPTNFDIVMEGVVKYADDGGYSISQEDFVNLLCALDKRFGCKTFGIQHYKEPLEACDIEKRLESEEHPLRRIEIESGFKPFHYHLVVMIQGKGIRIGTMARFICDFFAVPFKVKGEKGVMVNPFLHIQEAHDKCIGAIRYLTHIDDVDKKPFSIDDVITNDAGYLRFCMECSGGYVSASALMRIVALCEGKKYKIMDMVGLKFYNQFRWSIIDIIKEGYWNEVRL